MRAIAGLWAAASRPYPLPLPYGILCTRNQNVLEIPEVVDLWHAPVKSPELHLHAIQEASPSVPVDAGDRNVGMLPLLGNGLSPSIYH